MIVAGFGFTTSATFDSLKQALVATGYAMQIDGVATAADKTQTPAFVDFAKAQKCPVFKVATTEIEATQTQTQSPISARERGTGSVAEAAALSAAGPGATLIISRQISNDRMATCAIAKGPNL
ncbi:cobalamin biosynthesis protein [Ascidiaceihabitans sp.]|uniref:cobalamin biosynthesis protein n=1 Tax=Ascidiaceihabitans sp. TaxID=1872644 RepID=UPI00329A37BA